MYLDHIHLNFLTHFCLYYETDFEPHIFFSLTHLYLYYKTNGVISIKGENKMIS